MADHTPELFARIGTMLAGKYTLVRLLGAGGMGAVFEAVNTWTERRVAVKLMLGDATRDAELAHRFLREARAASRLSHPNVVDVLDMGQDPADGALYIVQEFLDGTDLEHVIQRRGALPAKETLEIITPVMSALASAHARGVLHRDVKPANIFLARTEQGVVPKLIDFGIARLAEHDRDASLTRTGAAVGTPVYMSPEQATAKPDVDQQADVWSVGVVLFECLAGRLPFDGTNYNAVIAAILTEPVPRLDAVAPSVSREIADVVAQALERDRSKRFPTMIAFMNALLACPTYEGEPWHEDLRTTNRKWLAPRPTSDTIVEDMAATPKVAAARPPAVSFNEGPGWAPPSDRAATTLGRASREIMVARSAALPPAGHRAIVVAAGVALIALATAASWRFGASRAHRPTIGGIESATESSDRVREKPLAAPAPPSNAPAAIEPATAPDITAPPDAVDPIAPTRRRVTQTIRRVPTAASPRAPSPRAAPARAQQAREPTRGRYQAPILDQ